MKEYDKWLLGETFGYCVCGEAYEDHPTEFCDEFLEELEEWDDDWTDEPISVWPEDEY